LIEGNNYDSRLISKQTQLESRKFKAILCSVPKLVVLALV